MYTLKEIQNLEITQQSSVNLLGATANIVLLPWSKIMNGLWSLKWVSSYYIKNFCDVNTV